MARIIVIAACTALILVSGFLKAHTNQPKTENQSTNNLKGKQEHQDTKPHNHAAHTAKADQTETNVFKNIVKLLGNAHPIAIHFPIALIVMTGMAEILFLMSPSAIYHHSARFMIIVAAISAIPAALLGLAYGYEVSYSGALENIFWWHRLGGISTAFLAGITAAIKELLVRTNQRMTPWYYGSLIASIVFVLITGYLGGEMTFGLFHMFAVRH